MRADLVELVWRHAKHRCEEQLTLRTYFGEKTDKSLRAKGEFARGCFSAFRGPTVIDAAKKTDKNIRDRENSFGFREEYH